MIVRRQHYLVNRKESVRPVCDKHYHTNKRKVQTWEEMEVLCSAFGRITGMCVR